MPSNEDADAKQGSAIVQSIEALWPNCTLQDCLPRNHSLRNTPVKEWPTSLLRLIEDFAKISPSQPMYTQARQRAFMTINEMYEKSDTLEDAVCQAKDLFTTLWPSKLSADLTVNKYYPKPNAIEDFGAWSQPNANDQGLADKAVLQAYQNAIKGRGAAFGDRSAGPTISTYLTVCRKRYWINPVRVAGGLWQGPDLPVKSGYGDVEDKVKDIIVIEAHFQMPFSQFWKMEDLRPEDAYFFPSTVLHGIVRIIEDFPMVKHDELYKLMIEVKKESRKLCRNNNSKTWFSITKANIENVSSKLQQMYDKTSSQTQTLDNGATSQGFDKRNRSLSPKLSSKRARKMPHTASTSHATGLNPSTSQAQSSSARQEAKEKIEKLRLEKREGAQRLKTLEDRIKNDKEEVRMITARQKEIKEEIKEELKGLGGASE